MDVARGERLRPIGEARASAEDPGPGPPAAAPLRIALAAAAVASCALFVLFACRSTLLAPYGDDHDWMTTALSAGADPARWFEPHNGQRIVWTRLLSLVAVRLGRESEVFLAWGLLSTALLVAALAAAPLRVLGSRGLGAALGAAAVLLATDAAAVQDAAWPAFSTYLTTAALAATAVVAFALRRGSAGLSVALACGLAAGLGNPAGLAVWPALAWLGWREGAARSTLVTLAAAAVAALAVGFGGVNAQAAAAQDASVGVEHLVKVASYLGAFCALPWAGGTGRLPLRLLGLAVAGLAVWLVLRPSDGASREGGDPLGAAGRGLATLGLIAAAMAAFGRVDELPQPIVPLRYAPFAHLLQIGVLFALAPELGRLWRARRMVSQVAWAATVAALLAQQPVVGAKVVQGAARVRGASAAFDRGDRDPAVVALVHPDPARAAAERAALRQAGAIPPAVGAP